MHYELTLEELLKSNSQYYIGDCASVSFNMGGIDYRLPILKAPAKTKNGYYKSLMYKQDVKSSATYLLINTITYHFYVGSSAGVYDRIAIHKSALKNNEHYNVALQNLYNKYGMESLDCVVLFTKNHEEAKDLEQKLITEFTDNPFMVNVSRSVRNTTLGLKMSSAFREKQSRRMSLPENKDKARARLEKQWNDPENSYKFREAQLKTVANEVMAFGNKYKSFKEAHIALNVSYKKFKEMLNDPLITEVYLLRANAYHTVGLKRTEESKRIMSENQLNDPIRLEESKKRLLKAVMERAISVTVNGVEYDSLNDASRATGYSAFIIKDRLNAAPLDQNGKRNIILPGR